MQNLQKNAENPLITSKVVNTLSHMMDKVVEQEINPDTVRSACLCAEKITELFKFHLEFEKFKLKSSLVREDIDYNDY